MTIKNLVRIVTFVGLGVILLRAGVSGSGDRNERAEKIFIQRPFSSPPTVKAPPYALTLRACPVANLIANWEGNLCGDLSSGELPLNPFGRDTFAEEGGYPFDLLKNKTLRFFRHALPVLKTYKALPKVARYGHADSHSAPRRMKRDVGQEEDLKDMGRGFFSNSKTSIALDSRVKRAQQLNHYNNLSGKTCDNAVFCKLLSTMYDKIPQGFQRFLSPEARKRISALEQQQQLQVNQRNKPGGRDWLETSETNSLGAAAAEATMPQTPCPSAAEYVTPVFARNHEGAWRYVVQIPREGYFTQTVEVTKCLQSSCNFLDGSCRSSPRWQSLLVAEIFYPDAEFPLDLSSASKKKNQNASSRQKRSHKSIRASRSKSGGYYEGKFVVRGNATSGKSGEEGSKCDGYDEIGCYQFRLFYDWFLIPGECKCWRRSFRGMFAG